MAITSVIGTIHSRLIPNRRADVISNGLLAMLPRNGDALDVGCGDGLVASRWSARRPSLTVRGIDVLIQPDAKIPVTLFDGRHLPFDDNRFEAVTFVDVLHHTEEPEALIREAARVSRRFVVIKDHVADNPIDRAILSIMDWVENASHGVALPYNYLSTSRWDAAFTSANLTVEARFDRLGLYPFPVNLICERAMHFLARLRKAGS